MKLLIIAGPYEADRIRKSAVAAGFETVAVEPGESLSGWITASRPQLIVMAPQMVNTDPALALAKVRSVPRGRVPIFLVGDEADEARMASLSEGFFVRPVSPEALLAHAKVVLAAERAREATNLGHEFTRGGRTPKSVPRPGGGPPGSLDAAPARQPGGLRPLVTAAVAPAPTLAGARGAADTSLLLAELGAGIDALMEAELTDALALTPKLPGPEAEFSAQPTADMKAEDVSGAMAAKKPGGVRAEAASGNGVAVASEAGAPSGVEERSEAAARGGGRARILSRYALVEAGDYFEVLGVSRDATAADVQQAHASLARELGPEGLDPGLAGELGAEIQAIRVVAGEALRILRDDRLRSRYRARI